MAYEAKKALDVVPLMLVTITPNAPFELSGEAIAQFTLPKAQIGGRGFALQVFSVSSSHGKPAYKPLWTFAHSTLDKTTLTFSFVEPKMTIAKGATYAVVLYGDDLDVSPSPSPSPSLTPSASSSPSQ